LYPRLRENVVSISTNIDETKIIPTIYTVRTIVRRYLGHQNQDARKNAITDSKEIAFDNVN
jgi:hypothetical protein